MATTATTLPKFNPTHDPRVDFIKGTTEDLINYIDRLVGDPRCKANAITRLEEASMWAVKSLFVGKPE